MNFANLAASLFVVVVVSDFVGHLEAMKDPWELPLFRGEVQAFRPRVSAIDATSMALGRFGVPGPAAESVEAEPPARDGLGDLGEIVSMTVGGARDDATLGFRFRDGTHRALAAGDALVERPHPEWGRLDPVPERYLFLGIESDPDRPGWRVLFDVETDGVTIERVFVPDRAAAPLPAAAIPAPRAAQPVGRPDRILIVRTDRVGAPGRFARPAAPRLVVAGPAGRLAVTREGRRYLEEHGGALLRDVETRAVRDRGLRIVRIRPESPAGRFGLRPGDTVLAVNGRPVRGRADAIRIAKEEARRPATRVLRVKISRAGREIVQELDIRDR